jgi:MORC family CW-type zinc finger protein
MRLGKDAVVFSKKGELCSMGLLSQTYLKAINASDVLIPMISWNSSFGM